MPTILRRFSYVDGMTGFSDVPIDGISGPPGATAFVFRPGGVAGANVYTDWSALMTDVGAVAGPRLIQFDDSIVTPCVIPAGLWNMNDVTWTGTAGGFNVSVDVDEGASFPGLRHVTGLLLVSFLGITPPVSDFAPNGKLDLFLMEEGATISIRVGAGPFFQTTDTSGGAAAIALITGATVRTDGPPAIDVAVAGSAFAVVGQEGAVLADGTVQGVPGSLFFVLFQGSSANLSEIQPAFAGTLLSQNITINRYNPTGTFSGPGLTNANENDVVRVDPTGGAFFVTLPAALNRKGMTIVVKNATASVNNVNISPSGGDTIDGGAGVSITSAFGAMIFVSDGVSDWMIVSGS